MNCNFGHRAGCQGNFQRDSPNFICYMLALSSLDRIEAKLEHWYVTGLRQQDIVPSLVASIGDTTSSLLKIEFETNPENSPADQTLIVQSQPVEVIYDAVSAGRKRLLKLSLGLRDELLCKCMGKLSVL